MLEYKGYVGTVAYDDVAEVLYARVINSGPYSVAEAEATDVVEGIKREFRKSIDLYLASCAEDGVEPAPPTGRTCRAPSDCWVVRSCRTGVTDRPYRVVGKGPAGGHETRPYSVEGWTHWAVSEDW